VERIGDSRIRLISQSNAGVSAARNAGIAQAKAEMIAFLDADDEWRPEFLATVLRLRENYPQCALFATSYEFCYQDGRTKKPIFRGIPPEPWEGVLQDYFAVAARSDPPVWTSAVTVRKSAIQSIGGFPIGVKLGEDLLTWARLAIHSPIAFTTQVEAIYYAPSQTDVFPRQPPDDPIGCQLKQLLGSTGSARRSMRAYIALWHKTRASCFLRAGQQRLALLEVWKSFCYRRTQWRLVIYGFAAILPPSAGANAIASWRTWFRKLTSWT
jgi:hypothetical protein